MEKMSEADYAALVASGSVAYAPDTAAQGSTEISEVERLTNELEAHEGEELGFVRRYREMLEETRDPVVKFLVQLIVTDEERHHAIAHAMVSTLKGSLAWTHMEDAIEGLYNLGKEKDKILKMTEDFLRLERKEIKEYKKLMQATKGYYHGLFNLLLKGMIHDSEKHVEILEFLKKRLETE